MSVATAIAKCPRGQKATGGGFRATPTQNPPFVNILESRKVGQRSWRASAQQYTGPSPLTLTVTSTVYCSEDAPKTKTSSTAITLSQPTAAGSATATCKDGKAQAGGFSLPPATTSQAWLALESARSGQKGWRATALRSTVATTFTVEVYCAKPKLKTRTGTTLGNGQLTQFSALSSSCRGGKPVAGGFSQPDLRASPTSDNSYFRVYESFGSSKQWRTSGIHTQALSTAPTTLNSFAYCT